MQSQLETMFERMGARVRIRETFSRNRGIDIRSDKRGKYFDIADATRQSRLVSSREQGCTDPSTSRSTTLVENWHKKSPSQHQQRCNVGHGQTVCSEWSADAVHPDYEANRRYQYNWPLWSEVIAGIGGAPDPNGDHSQKTNARPDRQNSRFASRD
jgi:hypothetical protein